MARTMLGILLGGLMFFGTLQGLGAQDAQVRIEGSGDDLTAPMALGGGLFMVGGAHRGDSNFIVQLLTAEGDLVNIPINAIGEYQGVRIVPIEEGTYRFQVQSRAPWVILYEQITVGRQGTPLPVSHEQRGDAPLGPITLSLGLLEATFSHEGDANFIVMLYHESGSRAGVLVNEIGDYEGTVSQRISEPGEYYLAVQADGNWSVTLTMN